MESLLNERGGLELEVVFTGPEEDAEEDESDLESDFPFDSGEDDAP